MEVKGLLTLQLFKEHGDMALGAMVSGMVVMG